MLRALRFTGAKSMASVEAMSPQFLSRAEVARWLNLHPRSLANMALKNRGPRFVRTSHLQGRALYRREDVLAWLESNVESRKAKAVSQAEPTSDKPSNDKRGNDKPAKRSRRRAKAGRE